MPLAVGDVVSAVGAPVVLGAVVVGLLRGPSPDLWASALVGPSPGGICASHWLTLLGAGLLLAVIRGAWVQAAVAWQSLLLASWCDAEPGRGQAQGDGLAGRSLQRGRQLGWQGRAVMGVRLLNLNLMGCWLYSYAIGEINSRRSVVEVGTRGGFAPTPNSLPPCLHTMNAATIVVWLGWWLYRMGMQGKVEWNRRQLVHLRVQSAGREAEASGSVQCAEETTAAAAAVASAAAEWRRGSSKTNHAARAVLLPESAGPCGLKTPLRPIVVAGNGVVFGRKPPPPAAHGRGGQLRECALACHAGWCAVDAPRVSTVHCALFWRTAAAPGEKDFVLYDLSASGVYLNGSSLSAAPPVDATTEGEEEAVAAAAGIEGQRISHGRAVGFGDRISLMVCASPHAEISFHLLPASAASWEWVSHAVEAERVAAVEVEVVSPSSSRAGSLAATAVGERQKLIENISVLEQQQLLYNAERGMILPSLMIVAMLLGIALWNVGRTLDCPVEEYMQGIVQAIQRSTVRAAARGIDKKPSAVEARRLVQPASILFFWWLLYSSLMATALLGGWCFLRSAEMRCKSSMQQAEEQLTQMLASNHSSPRANADGANQAAVTTEGEVSAREDEEEVQVQAERQALRQLDVILAADANDDKSTSTTRDHRQLAVALSAALRACGADEAPAASSYTAPHELRIEELRCPVSLTLMNTAVSVLPCGHVFDRPSLVSYIATANKTPGLRETRPLPARCPFGCDSSTMIVVPNDHVRKAVADARSSEGTSGEGRDPSVAGGDEDRVEGAAAEQSEYGDDDAVAAIFGSAEALTAYQALLADSALPAVFDCKGAKPRQLDALLLHLERVGWYNPLQHPLADGTSAKLTTDKLQKMLRVVQPLSTDLVPNGGHRWLLQPGRTVVLLTQILRRLLDSPGLSVAGRTQARIVVVRLLSKVAEIIAAQNSPELLLQLIRAAKTIDVVVELFDCAKEARADGSNRWSAANWNDRWNDATTNAQEEEQRERVWSYALNMLESCVTAHPALAVDVVEAGLLERVHAAAQSTANPQQQRELRRSASALVLQLLGAPLQPGASAAVETRRVTDATRLFVAQRKGLGLISWARAGGGAAELQLWALGVAEVAQGCGAAGLAALCAVVGALCARAN